MEWTAFPKDPDNPLTGFLNYDERTSVEHGTFRAWGEVIYRSPLTPDQMYQYELRPSRDNPDVRRTMAEQAQVVGTWEMRNHVPEGRRMTRYVHPGKFVAGKRVTPEELARQYRLAQDYVLTADESAYITRNNLEFLRDWSSPEEAGLNMEQQ